MPTKFAQALQKRAGKVFDKAKEQKVHRSGNSFGPADVPDGTFTAIISANADVISKGKMEGTPVVRFTATISGGEHEGKEPSKTFFLEGKPPVDPKSDEMPTAEQQLIGLLEFLLPDVEPMTDISDIESYINEVNGRLPLAAIGVRNRHVTPATGGNQKHYQDVFFNKVLQETTVEATDDPQDDSSEPEDNSEEGNADGTDYAPAAKDTVMVDDKEGEWKVISVSQSKQTANLKNAKGTVLNYVPWRELTLV